MDNLNVEIGKRLKIARQVAGEKRGRKLTRREVSEELDIAESTVQHHEDGLRGLKPDLILRYCRYYNLRAGWLIEGQGGMYAITDEVAKILDQMKSESARETWLEIGRQLSDSDDEDGPEIK